MSSRRSMVVVWALVVIGALLSGVSSPAAAQRSPSNVSDASGQAACGGKAATILGTAANDVLRGTPGADVIEAGGGDDTVLGGGGNDLICGGNGNDRLVGESDDDTLVGGPGNDTLVGGSGGDRMFGMAGDDAMSGDDGDDFLFGGDGEDRITGGGGNDRIAGGLGDDALSASSGNDYVAGGAGFDSGVGGQGVDTCAQLEAAAQCERLVAGDPDLSLAVAIVSPLPDATIAGVTPVTIEANSSAGIELVELSLDDEVVAAEFQQAGAGPLAKRFSVDFSQLGNGPHRLEAVVTDQNGQTSSSAPLFVVVANEIGPEGPSTGFIFATPVRLSELVPVLRNSDIRVVEFFDERPAVEPAPLPADLANLIGSEGISVVQPVESTTGGFYGRGLDTAEQINLYRDAYQTTFPGEDPLVFGLRVEGSPSASVLGPLAPLVVNSVPVEPRQSFSGEGARTAAQSQSAADVPADAPDVKNGARTESEASAGGTAPQAATAREEPAPWWPTFGQFDTKEYKLRRSFIPPRLFEEKRVTFVHDLVWTPAALANFGGDRAYEHDLKTTSPGRSGRRPACSPFSEDNFYAYRTGLLWGSTLPGRTAPYLDTDVLDRAGAAVAHRFVIDTKRGNQDDGSFSLVAQSLDRETASCERFPRQLIYLCIGLDGGQTRGASIIRTDGTRIPGIKLPACVVWKWLPVGSADGGPDVVNRCGGDRDGDGYDNSVDCAPDNRAVNPGAVDIPNDGIDQNCDGSDLIVGTGKVQVTLIWDNEVDMDLHVREPNGTEIWYANRGPTSTGGQLDRDDNVCGTADRGPGGVENIFWPNDVTAPSGAYLVEVVEYGRCGQSVASWILEIRVNGNLVKRETGSGGGFRTTFTA